MYKNKGSNLVEYVIPLAVIALVVGLGLYYMFSNGSMLNFAAKSSNMDVQNDAQKGIINPLREEDLLLNPTAGSLGGTLDSPTGKCIKGNCIIDYGDFILTNIPEDFNDFIQTSGTSGGVQRMANHLSNIAQGLKDKGMFDLANEIQELANMGHSIALILQEYERIYNLCAGNSACIDGYKAQAFPMPDGFNTSVLNFPPNATYADLIDSAAFGSVVAGSYNSPLASAFVEQYNQIINNASVQDEVKGILQELTWGIGSVGQDFLSNYSSLTGTSINYYDPITGASSSAYNVYPNPIDNYSKYNASRITNYYSTLICSTGYGLDSGTNCH
ncbi:MAG: hypothetical protein AB1782_05480 [Cyanobacteriota bacterium]